MLDGSSFCNFPSSDQVHQLLDQDRVPMRFGKFVLLVVAITLVAGGDAAPADKTKASVAASVGSSAVLLAAGESRFLRTTGEGDDSIDGFDKEAVALDAENEEERGLKEVFKKLLVEFKFYGKELPLIVWWGFRMSRWLGLKVPPAQIYEKLKVYRAPEGSRNYRVYVAYWKLFENKYGPAFNPLMRASP
ncbi:hypothetical protein PRIC1_008211 [Phytophthora ramorum]